MTHLHIQHRPLQRGAFTGADREALSLAWYSRHQDLYMESGKETKPFLALLTQLICKDVEVRLIHAKRTWLCFSREF